MGVWWGGGLMVDGWMVGVVGWMGLVVRVWGSGAGSKRWVGGWSCGGGWVGDVVGSG